MADDGGRVVVGSDLHSVWYVSLFAMLRSVTKCSLCGKEAAKGLLPKVSKCSTF